MKKKTDKKIPVERIAGHDPVFREWCMNCRNWRTEKWCDNHQVPVLKCVICSEIRGERL